MRKIIHVDMDAFYASVEQRDFPQYRGKPIVVGGRPEKRGAVAAASYEARKFGIHSAMPSRVAQQRCQDLIFVSPRFEVYREVSQHIRAIFHQYTDLVEPLALDEAYLDVTKNKVGEPSATLLAQQIKQDIYTTTHLTASAGVSVNKFLAKIASGLNKPNGLTLIRPEEVAAFVEALPIEKFHGIGQVTAGKMRELGIYTGADLKQWSEPDLVRRFGKVGYFYYGVARGIDPRPVNPNRIRKSIGAERSYSPDLNSLEAMVTELESIADKVTTRLRENRRRGHTLTLKVKYADYRQVTRSRTFVDPIGPDAPILDWAKELLLTHVDRGQPVRLLGIAISNLEAKGEVSYVQLSLFSNLSIDKLNSQ
jgi:DNA polymerase-4